MFNGTFFGSDTNLSMDRMLDVVWLNITKAKPPRLHTLWNRAYSSLVVKFNIICTKKAVEFNTAPRFTQRCEPICSILLGLLRYLNLIHINSIELIFTDASTSKGRNVEFFGLGLKRDNIRNGTGAFCLLGGILGSK